MDFALMLGSVLLVGLVVMKVGMALKRSLHGYARTDEQAPQDLTEMQRRVRTIIFPWADLSPKKQDEWFAKQEARQRHEELIRSGQNNADQIASAVRSAAARNTPYDWSK